GMAKRAPQFIDAVNKIDKAGYDMDYISDNFIRSCECINKKIVTAGGASYKAIILPGVKMIPVDVFQKLLTLASEGATVIFLDGFPTEVPGFGALEKRRNEFRNSLQALPKVDFHKTLLSPFGKGKIITGKDYTNVLEAAGTMPEYMKAEQHLRSIRRNNPDGYHYFVSALKATDTDEWITLSVSAKSVMLFDPLTGKRGKAAIRQREGKTQVRLQLSSGASMILKTFTDTDVSYTPWNYISSEGDPVLLNEDWKLYFVSSIPDIKDTFQLKKIGPWTDLPIKDATVNMGTVVYSKTFNLKKDKEADWILDLGDVRETARVRINGQNLDTLWAVPYKIPVGSCLRNGTNTIEIEVTGLPANRIADMDRQNIEWRNFKEINMVDIHYKNTKYDDWAVMPAGLNNEVKLIPVTYE
ncbi:MAG TPA: glycosyl hydrolase, partial [Bacteroidales bacterium]|nr:glycosyl hydrolase [Bacteroidales bacterium]